ncbi:hypothetical protein [Marinomonas mediterranea]|jgi:hypothetical protein|uniref:DinB-like domain-containing protein n=1 Tax=Marinomonas mediterranea (strain ATCC 700492 / JCM 21426 / NBRC 103028 / MMB-1) TaxID=717774 RepID=F2JYS3_MARM1|nr:hypothetical protein [Marinomonas mediterranea]ADZ89698.1 hypothetical protein Marme_0398 [Marinomonas mediterranea MMB-1]
MTVISINSMTDNEEMAAIEGGLEVLQQGLDCLNSLSQDQYVHIAKPHMMSSIGAHYRHLLDVFHAVASGVNREEERSNAKSKAQARENCAEKITVDYNLRRRGHDVETSIKVAKQELKAMQAWLLSLNSAQLNQAICVINEVSVSRLVSSKTSSTLGREITFASLHANHHYAMIKVALSLSSVEANALFGIAPATATYLRGES